MLFEGYSTTMVKRIMISKGGSASACQWRGCAEAGRHEETTSELQ